MPRIMVVGASGFVGAHTARRVVEDGHEVCAFAPAPEPCLTAADVRRMRFVSGDVTDPRSIAAAVESFAPDAVIGLAAWGEGGEGLMAAARADRARADAVNVAGLRNLLEACRQRGVPRIVWASTGAVFGDPDRYPPDGRPGEDAPALPETAYGDTKRRAEEVSREFRGAHGLDVAGLRLPLVFGPGLWYRGVAARILDLFSAAAAGGRVALDMPPGPLDLVYVKDAARAFAFLAAAPGPLDAMYNLHVCAPTAAELVRVVRTLAPGLSVTLNETAAANRFPVMRGERLAALGFAPAWSLREACADTLAAARR